MADSFRRIHGKTFDAGSTILTIGGEKYEGWKSIKGGQKRTRVKAGGISRARRARVRTAGMYEAEDLVISMLKSSAQDLRDDLCRVSGSRSYGDAEVTIVMQFVEDGVRTVVETYEQCAMVSDGTTVDDNADPLYEDVTFSVMGVRRNGKTLYSAKR